MKRIKKPLKVGGNVIAYSKKDPDNLMQGSLYIEETLYVPNFYFNDPPPEVEAIPIPGNVHCTEDIYYDI